MEPRYEDFLYRIVEERERLMLKQEAVAVKLGLSQSRLSKNELGKNRFSFLNLQIMSHLKFDLYYAFTGNRLQLKINDMSVLGQRFFLENIFIALSEYDIYSFEPRVRQLLDYIKYVSYFSYTGDRNVYKILTLYDGMTQMELADLLGIAPKKLRQLQNHDVMPDSEIMFRTVSVFGITPMTLLEDENSALYQADYVINLLDEHMKGSVLELLQKNKM